MSDYLLNIALAPPGMTDLKISRLEGYEELGRSFEYTLELTSPTHSHAADAALGKPMAIHIESSDEHGRYVHGRVTSFEYLGSTHSHASYQVTLRPWTWLLSKNANCRIFQQKTAPNIVLEVFRAAGFSDFENGLTETYHTRDYCVQYRESDLDFVTRLMEQEGFYFFFVHSERKHLLKLVDGAAAHPATPQGSFVYNPSETTAQFEQLRRWRNTKQLRTTHYRLQDYNFLTPSSNLETASQVVRVHTDAGHEIYDYPGPYENTTDGTHFVKVRAQEQQATFERCEGEGAISSLTCGESFEVVDHTRGDQNKKYLALSTRIIAEVSQRESSAATSSGIQDLRCEVAAVPTTANFRLASLTRQPRIQGPQTAVVVGPADQEIYTDEHARVKLKFHWDRINPKNENASCWVRVSQAWAGGTWGAIHIPRIGQEVIVEFLEGDPDRPIVTGRVYNAALMPPYELSANATQSGIKSRSSPEGDAQTFNELRFEDKKDAEQIYFHAEKNFDRVVENNDTLKIGFDKKDKGDQTIEIFNNQTITIGHDDAEAGNRTTLLVKGNELLTVAKGNRTVLVDEGNDKHQIKKGNREILIDTADDLLTIAKGNRVDKIDTGNDALTIAKGNREVKVDTGNDTLTVAKGDLTIAVTAGSVKIEAGTAIELVVGSNSIKIEQSGITISAAKVSISATGNLELSGSGEAKLESGGIVTVKGSLVKIN